MSKTTANALVIVILLRQLFYLGVVEDEKC